MIPTVFCAAAAKNPLSIFQIECSFSKQIWLYIAEKFGTPAASTNAVEDFMLNIINGCDASSEDN